MKTPIYTSDASEPGGFYSQAVRAGEMLFISGQLPLEPGGDPVNGSATEQTIRAMKNVQAILKAAGADLSELVQVTIYVSNIDLWPEVDAAYRQFMSGVPVPPARAVVPVNTPLHFDTDIEIQATAYLD